MKNYLLTLLAHCSDEDFGQRAVEWAIVCGHVTLTYDLQRDLQTIVGRPPSDPSDPSDFGCYDAICAGYRQHCAQTTELLVESYAPLLQQLQPCHESHH